MSEVKVTVVSREQIKEEENEYGSFNPPSQWYCLNAVGDHVYFHYRGRVKCQQKCNEYFGGYKYNVRPSSITGNRDKITAK